MENKLLLVDGNALLYRAFFAFPPLTTPKGEPIGAVYGFCRIFLSALRTLRPTHVLVAFDLSGPTFRHEQYKEYKATRQKMPSELAGQIERMHEVVEHLEVPIYTEEGYEADDLIGTIAIQAKNENFEVVILTGDQDILQVVQEKISVYSPGNSKIPATLFTPEKVIAKYGFSPQQIVDYKALRGDPSDNIPGVPGIGEVTAKAIIEQYKSIDNLYEELEKHPDLVNLKAGVKQKLTDNKKLAQLSYQLATINTASPVTFNAQNSRLELLSPDRLVHLFEELGFKSLIAELPKTHRLLSEAADIFNVEQPSSTSKPTVNVANPILEINPETNLVDNQPQNTSDLSASEQTDLELAPVLRKMEQIGIKVDNKYLKKLESDFNQELATLKQKLFDLAGQEFNPDSPQQVCHIFYEILKIPTTFVRKGKTGYSTDAATLKELSKEFVIAQILLNYREVNKLQTTYIRPLQELADSHGRVHTSYAPDTASGRISSKNPNLQNIPTRSELGASIRQAFIADQGKILLAADYSQIELRVAAHFSEDPVMLQVFKEDGDYHKTTAEKMNVDRRIAKIINFSILYGKGAYGFSQDMGIPLAEAKEYIENYFKTFAGLKLWINKTLEKARLDGFTETMYGKKRYLPDLNSSNFQRRSAAEREAINQIIQGTAAEILKISMCQIDSAFEKQGLKSQMLLTVHDELVFEIAPEEELTVRQILNKHMVENFNLKAPLKISTKKGSNWKEMIEG